MRHTNNREEKCQNEKEKEKSVCENKLFWNNNAPTNTIANAKAHTHTHIYKLMEKPKNFSNELI